MSESKEKQSVVDEHAVAISDATLEAANALYEVISIANDEKRLLLIQFLIRN